jgi:hypothetical protein
MEMTNQTIAVFPIFLVTNHSTGVPELLTTSESRAEDHYWYSMAEVCHPDDFDSTLGYVEELNSDDVEHVLGRPLSDVELIELSEYGYTYL